MPLYGHWCQQYLLRSYEWYEMKVAAWETNDFNSTKLNSNKKSTIKSRNIYNYTAYVLCAVVQPHISHVGSHSYLYVIKNLWKSKVKNGNT